MPMPALFHPGVRRTLSLATATVVALVALAGCSVWDGATKFADPYKTDIVQGNFVSKEQVDALQAGMSRLQVRDILGTPLLTSIFHADRWDYIFTLERRKVESQKYRLTVYFNGDALDRFDGDTMPTEAEFVSNLDAVRSVRKAPVLEASEESLSKFPASTPASLPQPLPPAGDSYPPLESPAL